MNFNYLLQHLSNVSGQWLDSLYYQWLREPDSIATDWQLFFSGFEFGREECNADDHSTPLHDDHSLKLSGVQSLIYRYRSIGHLLACTDPLSPCKLEHPLLKLQEFGLDESDLETVFTSRRYHKPRATLLEILDTMRETYCREIGVEFMHIPDPRERQWLIDRMEPCLNRPFIDAETQLDLLKCLHEANLFESFLQWHFPAQKRFSLEGGEILIQVLNTLVSESPAKEIHDIVLGMAHRGRLNVLAHIFGKPYENIFSEFRDAMPFGFIGDGDVKYHKGCSVDRIHGDGRVHVTLLSNPSHLEAVNPVLEGKCRARQERYGQDGFKRVLPVLVHGDAAFAGQGSVMETLNLSQLEGYCTGGTVHIVLNNQIGFTTLPKDSRSTLYATDVAKMLSCPIFHVQGESPEAALHAARLALAYRQAFSRDVVIELICYRRHGHNEGDEPVYTQPEIYQQIEGRPPVNRIYASALAEAGISPSVLQAVEQTIAGRLDHAFNQPPRERQVGYKGAWESVSEQFQHDEILTGVSAERLLRLARRLADLPPGFTPHAKIHVLLQRRFESILKGNALDWGTAETLAYASLLEEGVSVRLSGQDTRRGTFSHRHAVLHDMHDFSTYTPLAALAADTAVFSCWDSPLSEYGVLGFEYGYSLEMPHGLTVWEAQFGDFANGAQVIIDQFITSGETKWNRASGLVMLLPHGYEGQGAEHSSARIERFLQLCADNNMMVVNPTTPAQLFHLLRRQVKQTFRRPLVVFTPKSLLRHPACVSSAADLSEGSFREIIPDDIPLEHARNVLICSGKIYYDLLEERTLRGMKDTAIVRIEQLYPFRMDLFHDLVARFPKKSRISWVQEEPENMGAWHYMQQIVITLKRTVRYVGRQAHSSPAVGSHRLHLEQQKDVVQAAFNIA